MQSSATSEWEQLAKIKELMNEELGLNVTERLKEWPLRYFQV